MRFQNSDLLYDFASPKYLFVATYKNYHGPSDYGTKSTRQRQHHLHVEPKKKNDTNELIYKTEIDLQTQKTNLWLTKGKVRRDKLGIWD